VKKQLRLTFSALVMGILLVFSGCGVTVKVDDPVGAARAARDAAERNRQTETATTEQAATDGRDFSEILPVFADRDAVFDDQIGFEEYYLVENDSTVRTIAGSIWRQFYSAPEGRSPLEIMRYYQKTINDNGGTIIFQTRDPLSIEIDGKGFISYYNKEKLDHIGHRGGWDYNAFNRNLSEYLLAKISQDDSDIYFAITAGRGGSLEHLDVVFEIVSVETEILD